MEQFNYTYSAKQQEEIKKIRNKYMSSHEAVDKMTRLRKLDQSVTSKATTKALIIGIIGALIMGLGMSLVMTELGEILGCYRFFAILIGVIIGMAGMILICCAYPVYTHTLTKEREKIAPEIIRLTDELMQ